MPTVTDARQPDLRGHALPRLAIAALLSATLVAGTAMRSAPRPLVEPPRTHAIGFVCRNGVAMSVWSAASFNRLAERRGLPHRAFSRASVPSFHDVPLRMRVAIALDGLRVGSYRPRVISAADVRAAERLILIDTTLPAELPLGRGAIERWEEFPPMRERYWRSRAELRKRVEALVEALASGDESR